MAEPDREAYEEAERLVREAREAEAAARPPARIPPNGWSSGGAGAAASRTSTRCSRSWTRRAARSRPSSPRQLADALRDLLIAIRAVLDYSIERLERPPRAEPEVEDIPIR